jgi:hypothetical protein
MGIDVYGERENKDAVRLYKMPSKKQNLKIKKCDHCILPGLAVDEIMMAGLQI